MITAEQVPPGSYAIRVFAGDPETSPIKAVLLLENCGGGRCEASMAHGSLENETNELIGLKAMELGFSVMDFKVLKGDTASRWASFLRSDDYCDYYRVNLERAVEERFGHARTT